MAHMLRVPTHSTALLLLGLLGWAVCRSAAQVWNETGSLDIARDSHTATLLLNGNVLVAGGENLDGGSALDSAELYDPTTGKWTSTEPLHAVRYLHTATLLSNGEVLVAGGFCLGPLRRRAETDSLASAELYDPATGAWTLTGSLNTARSSHTATRLLDGNVLVAGGDNGATLNSAELYDPTTGVWTATGGSLITGRYEHTATLLPDGNVLVAGGYNNAVLDSAELYDPATGVWTPTGRSLNTARYSHTATLLLNGNVLVAGGATLSVLLDSVELYDPTTGVWTPTGSLSTARYSHTATLLSSGKVLVAGGQNGDSLDSAEVYDPSTGVWTGTVNLISPRGLHSATLLQNGNVLAAGGLKDGEGISSESLSSAELYLPFSPAVPTASASPSPTPLEVATVWITAGTASLSGQVAITHDVSNTKDCLIVPSAGPVMTGFTVVTSSASICCRHTGVYEQGNGRCTNMPCGTGTLVYTNDYAPRSTAPLQPGDGCILIIDSTCYDTSQNVAINLFQGSKFTGTAAYGDPATKRTAPASSTGAPLRDVFVYTAPRGFEPAFLVSTATSSYGCVALGTVIVQTGCEIPWGCTTTIVSDYIYDASGSGDCFALCYAS